MSPMRYASEKRRALTAIFIVFLFIFSEILVAQNDHEQELGDSTLIGYSIYQYTTLSETHIQSDNPNTNYLSSSDTLIGENILTASESRGLYRFSNNLSNTVDSIIDAELSLTCNVNSEANPGTPPQIYAATIIANFAPNEVNWNEIADSINWQTPGIDGSSDRTVWDVPSTSTLVAGTIREYTLNVTKLAQTSLELGRNKFDFVLTSLGGELSCFKNGNGNPNYDPLLTINNFQGVHGNGGSATVDFLEDGMPLMTDDFIPAPDTHPVISYQSLIGSGMQFQFSKAADFRSVIDQDWVYSTTDNSFTINGNAGEYDIPANQAFSVGDTIQYRYRTIDTTSKISDWTTGSFFLPGYSVTNNNDGTATLNLDNDGLNLQGYNFITDTYVDSSNPTTAYGGQGTLKISNGPSENSLTHMSVNLHLLGLPSNATVISSNLNLERESSTPTAPVVSVHEFTGDAWDENEATWNYGKIGNSWTDGGLSTIGTSEDSGIDSAQVSNLFSLNVQDSVQNALTQQSNHALRYVMTGFLPTDQAPSTLESVTFASVDYDTSTGPLSQPSLELTYSWSANSSGTEASLITPVNGQPTWNNSNGNLSGNTTPILSWEPADNSAQNSLIQVSTDPYYRTIILEQDSRTNSNPPSVSDQFEILGSNALSTGSIYYWRVKHIDNDGLSGTWNETSFFVSTITSQWLGGDLHRLVINSNTEPILPTIPEFSYSTITSSSPNTNSYGYPYLSVADIQSGKSNALLGFNLINYILPNGLAVVGSELSMHSLSAGGSPNVGIWAMSEHNWNQEEVTWLESSDGVSWSGAGATGSSDRTNLLDSQVVSGANSFTWNITSAMQDSMRDVERLDLLIEVLPGQSNANALFYSPMDSNPVFQPTLEIIYSPGSNQKPLPPSAQSPANGAWAFVNNSSLEANSNPEIEWSPNNVVQIVGWGLEIDTSEDFDTPNKRTVSSWNNPGFDVINNTYTLQSDLQIGQQWFWRVRGLSSTYQLGEWSQAFHFYLPDFDVNILDSNTYTTEYYHNSAINNGDILRFIDASIIDSSVPTSNNIDQPFLTVGTTSNGQNSSMLVKIPIPIEMHPENASVVEAQLKLQSTPLSNLDIPVAVRGVLKPWDESLSNTQYNSTSNWSQLGGRGIGSDITAPVDIQNSTVGEMVWDITTLAQRALALGQPYISVMLYAESTQPGNLVYFQSSEFSSGLPTINMTWAYGQRDRPANTPVLLSPASGQIYFNQTSHAVIPDLRPTFDWQWPTGVPLPDAWRILFDLDPNNDMAGRIIFDSRYNTTMFDVANSRFTPNQDIDYGNEIQWSVQAINNSMYGEESLTSVYLIPTSMGAELSSTDAVLEVQDGTMYQPTNFPSATTDIYLDEGTPTVSQDTNGLMIGNSSIVGTNLSTTTAVVSFDLSSIALPSVYEVLSADLTLTAVSGSGTVEISASRMLTNWDESATWNDSTSGTSWNNSGALRGSDSDLPDSLVSVTSVGEHTWNVTRIMQLSIEAGSQQISILLQPEIFNSPGGVVDGNYIFADSENITQSIRPKLTLEYRTTEQWLAPSPTPTAPANSATLWNTSSYELTGPDSIAFDFTTQTSNVTNWNICHGQEIRWLDCESSQDPNSLFSYDSATNSFDLVDLATVQSFYGDQWQYWRIRGDQDHRIGHYSQIYEYRMSNSQVYADGTGNYSLNLSRGSLFESTGDLPAVIDAATDSGNQIANTGADSVLMLGFNPSTAGISQAYFSFNLSDIYFDPIATPISAVLELQLASSTQNINPFEVSVFACDQFVEASVTYTNAPTCSNTEVTKTTISSNSGTDVEWDITSLLQTNFFTNNDSVTFTLVPEIGVTNNIEFYSSENIDNLKPNLKIIYIENIGGLTPPSQPVLSNPSNGEILYDTSDIIISSPQSVQLDWVQNPDATDYILFISNQNNIISYDSRETPFTQGNSFTSNQFAPGEVYEWWVQAINQTIPGPSSPRWSFAIGDPSHQYSNDGTYSYSIADSSEVSGYSHINVLDNTITDALPLANFGFSQDLSVGKGCYNTAGSTCDIIISLDTSQIPVDPNQAIHSVELTFFVDDWDFSGSTFAIDLSVHQFLISNWNELGITWNSTGATPGPVAGVDYISTPLDQQTFFGSATEISFQVATDSLILGDDILLLVRGTTQSVNNNDGYITFHSSEAAQSYQRPSFDVYHTNISSLNITTSATSFNADDTYVFDLQGFDYNGITIAGGMPTGAQIEWSSTTGTITGTGLTTAELSPTTNGQQTITACFGVICADYVINLDSGLPVQLFASLDQSTDVNEATITADETITVSASAIDQHGNLVTNEIISFVPSNGSIDANGVFSPYTASEQTITVEWVGTASTLQEVLTVDVQPGVPVTVTMSGCTETIAADTSCDLFGSAYDQYGNPVWFDDVVSYSLSAEDGETTKIFTPTPHSVPPVLNVLIGEYTGNAVGQWTVSLTTDLGIGDTITADVTHGVLDSFTLTSSAATITADDFLYINATRIDVRGNELPLTLPIENWTNTADGVITPGQIAIWSPNSQGTKTIAASYQGLTDSIDVFVVRGVISELQLIIGDEVSNGGVFSITADETITASIMALDAKGNQWLVDGNWTYFHPDFAEESALSSNYSQEVTFTPTLASSTPYAISVEHQEGDLIKSANFVVYVSVGDIENFIVGASDSNGIPSTEVENFDITADDFIEFDVATSDTDLNIIDNAQVTWLIEQKSTGEVQDITAYMASNALVWNAVVVGDWEITAYIVNERGFNLTSQFDISVSHGVPVILALQQSVTTQDAGNFVDLQVTGTDADGNQFPQPVVWFENNGPAYNINSTNTEGIYQFNGRSAGNYTLTAEYLTLSSSVIVEVFPLSTVKNIKTNISTTELEQLESIIVEIKAYDEYWNIIPVPESARIDSTDRGDIKYQGNGVWKLETLDEGEHSATVVIGSITETFTYNVEGNLAGFFAAGGPLYYVGAVLIALIVVALLIFLIRLVRGDDDYYDDDDEDYDDDQPATQVKDFSQPRISQAPTVPTPPPQPPSPEPEIVEEEPDIEEDNSWMADYRVEDDGTEWGQTEDGVWYYREAGSEEWVEWTE